MICSARAPAPPAELTGVNVAGFCSDSERLKAETYRQIGPADFAHLRRIERCGRIAAFLGLATAWMLPNPDLAERNLEFLRQMQVPVWIKYVLLALAACTWKIIYYAPKSLSVLDPVTRRRLHHSRVVAFTMRSVFDFRLVTVRRL